jgi:hypothetical protein
MLAGVLGAHAVTAAPVGLAAGVASAALGSVAASGGMTLSLFKLMAMTQLKIAAGVAVAAAVGTTLVLEHRALTRLREQNQALEQQVAQMRSRAPEGRPSSDVPSPSQDPAKVRETQLQDLNRLRGEVGALRQQPNDLARLRATNSELRAATDEPDDPAEAEFREQTQTRVVHLKQWGLSFILYANGHNGELPRTFEEAAHIQNSEPLLGFDTNHFEITYQGTLESITDPGKTIVFREKQARRSPKGEWLKVYGMGDGSVEVRTEGDEAALAAWEKERVVAGR